MGSRSSPVTIAAQACVAELASSKLGRRALLAGVFVLLALAVTAFAGGLDARLVTQLRRQVLVPLIPLGALLLGDAPLRQGIGERTLLHHLLGPVPRTTLAMVRTVVVAGLLAAEAAIVLGVLGALAGAGPGELLQDTAAAVAGAWAYLGLASGLYALTRRGFVIGLCALVFVDLPLGSLPFALRDLAPSAHLTLASGRLPSAGFGAAFGPLVERGGSAAGSLAVLLVLGALGTALAALRFRRMALAELC